jgi:hypothetical protein
MRRPIILGMNSATGRALLPSVAGRVSAADRLLKMSGLPRAEFLTAFRRKNLLDGKEWDHGEAARRAAAMRFEGDVVVLGKSAWRALGLPRSPFFSEVATSAATFHLVPHPSGRCRAYNFSATRRETGRLLRRLATRS